MLSPYSRKAKEKIIYKKIGNKNKKQNILSILTYKTKLDISPNPATTTKAPIYKKTIIILFYGIIQKYIIKKQMQHTTQYQQKNKTI